VVAWHKGNVYAQEDVAMLQRLNPDMGKRGSAIQIPSLPGGGVPDGVPDVAMTRDGSRIVIAGRSTSHDIWASAYEFAGGNAALPTFRVNARQGGSQRKPIVASLDSGEFLVAWLDDVGVDTRTASVIAAQVFDSDGYPRDVDFTVTTDEPIASQIPDPPLDFDQFPFDVASSGNDYVAAWRVSGGIKLQWIKGRKASVECPLTTGCGTAVPLRITGPTQEKIDVILSPGQVVRDDTGVLLPDFAPPYPSNTPEFARKAVDLIVNGYLASNLFASHIDQFNFYYDMSQGIRRMIYDQYGCRLTGETASGRNEINEVLGFSGNKSFVDVAGVIFKSYKAWVDGCYLEEPGLAYMREGSKTDDMNIRSGAWSSFWIRDSSDYSTFLHESGHAVFGLREEYCSIGAKEDTHYHSNTFADLNSCSDNTAHTDTSDCREIGNCDGISKADADTCPMIGGGGMQFDADCLKRAQCMIDGLTHEECP
jgi:hypothetical protein